MITTLTEQFILLRQGFSKTKKELVEHLLDFVNLTKPGKNCLLCTNKIQMEETSTDLSTDSRQIEHKLCKICIEKLHSKNCLFCLKLRVSEKYHEIQQFAENICGIQSLFSANIAKSIKKRLTVKDVEELFAFLGESGKDAVCLETQLVDRTLIENMKNKLRNDKIKQLLKKQLELKIRIFDEQLESLRKNYAVAMLAGEFDNSDALRSTFFKIFESKIKLEERLAQYKTS